MNPVEALNSFIPYLVAFVPMLGILILVHELGHFLVAKYFGVRVLKFSIGFGSPIGVGRLRMRWTSNGTEYVVAWIPLGGYVKMLGEQLHDAGEDEPDVPDARPDEYLNAKPVWQKLCITFAGPAMNLLLPVLIFMGVFAWGIQQPVAIVGTVEIPSPASDAGVLPDSALVAQVEGRLVAWKLSNHGLAQYCGGGPRRTRAWSSGQLFCSVFQTVAGFEKSEYFGCAFFSRVQNEKLWLALC